MEKQKIIKKSNSLRFVIENNGLLIFSFLDNQDLANLKQSIYIYLNCFKK